MRLARDVFLEGFIEVVEPVDVDPVSGTGNDLIRVQFGWPEVLSRSYESRRPRALRPRPAY